MPAQARGAERWGIADKACWTEPLVAGAKLAGSMGIVKGYEVEKIVME